MADSSKNILYRSLFITVLLLAAYGNTLNHGFVWDDFNIIVESPLTEKLTNIPRFFITEDTADGGPTGYYRPITYVSFALDRALWGLNPVGFNITNLVLHILVALVFYRVVAALFKREDLALVAALVFALHPIAGETVNFHAGGRNTLLSAFFALLSLLFHVKKRQLPAVACFTLAIFSKEFAILLPAVFFLYDRTVNNEETSWHRYVPYVAALACYFGLRSLAVTNANLFKSIVVANLWIIPQLVINYLKSMAFPLGLKTMYDVNAQFAWPSFLIYCLLLAVLISVAIICRKRREILFSIILFLLFLLPVTNIFFLGTTMMADRYAYFALFGFSLALAYCICLAGKRITITIMLIVCLLFIAIDSRRNGLWRDEMAFFTQMIKDAPEMSTGYQNLGYNFYIRHDYANAEKYLTVASTKKALSGTMLVGSAAMFLDMNKPDKALVVLGLMMHYEPDNPRPYVMASRIHEQMGNQSLASSYHDKAVALSPGVFEFIRERSSIACRQGEELMSGHKTDAAERLFKEALSIDPGFVPALVDMGSVAAGKGELVRSMYYFTRAATLDPLNPAPHYNMSMLYESMGEQAKAREEMNKFKELDARSRQK